MPIPVFIQLDQWRILRLGLQVSEPGQGGDVEFLKSNLGAPITLHANELFWITDEVMGSLVN